ncbi:hypothetical protein F2Q68_00003722 [Brassica cretica]|uniref:Uncharacterized protein n=1 Tax=Brassica cretica TaxID=69181 RepID=A0A8S9JHR8_BRACR|nr:hypothetical protein F2Q68_00003722 [Brassica cretica]
MPPPRIETHGFLRDALLRRLVFRKRKTTVMSSWKCFLTPLSICHAVQSMGLVTGSGSQYFVFNGFLLNSDTHLPWIGA